MMENEAGNAGNGQITKGAISTVTLHPSLTAVFIVTKVIINNVSFHSKRQENARSTLLTTYGKAWAVVL